MLRITTSSSEARAKAYYTKGFSREDYYSESQEVIGSWRGNGAERLGLSGRVDKKSFDLLCENRNPLTGEPLTVRTKSNRRVGYDFTFSVPKSVSVVQGITGDRRIVEDFEAVVEQVMNFIESEMQTRVRTNGQDYDRKTGNMIRANFTHFTARPENGIADPHLHEHCYVFNATYDEQEKRWKAGQFVSLKRDGAFYEAMFDNLMSQKLIERGYQVVRKGKSYEIVGIPESTLKQFSRRTARINQIVKEKNIDDPKQRDAVGAATRGSKMKDVSLSDLREIWISQLDPAVLMTINRLYSQSLAVNKDQHRQQNMQQSVNRANTPGQVRNQISSVHQPISDGQAERTALDFAILHTFERSSVVDERRLLTTALQFGVGSLDLKLLQETAKSHPELLRKEYDGRIYLTTPEVIVEEQRMIDWVKRSQGTMLPLVEDHHFANRTLTDEQRNAVLHVLESMDRVVGITGKSGTGKTTAMKEAIDAMEDRGHRVFVFSPTAKAAHQTLARDFKNTNTIAQLLYSDRLQQESAGAIWWIDEAGLVSGRDMARVAELAQRIGVTKVVLSGDTEQHRSVERGDALRILEKYADLKTATISQIQRQEGVYKEAVEDLANGKMKEAFEKLDSIDAIREIDSMERYRMLADEYITAKREGATSLVISPTHSEIRKVTELVRQRLKEDGHLQNEQAIEILKRVDTTDALRADTRSYREGWLLEMNRNAGGYQARDRFTVEEILPSSLIVRDNIGKQHEFDVQKLCKSFEIFEREEIGLAPGDMIRISRNGHTVDDRHHEYNGSLHTLAGFTVEGDLLLAGGKVISRDYGHLTWGYAHTSHTAQGETVERVFIAESSESFAAANRQQFYVSVSRGKKVVQVYTDDREELLDAVQANSHRLSAMDIGIDQEHTPKVEDHLKDFLGQLSPRSAQIAAHYAKRRDISMEMG